MEKMKNLANEKNVTDVVVERLEVVTTLFNECAVLFKSATEDVSTKEKVERYNKLKKKIEEVIEENYFECVETVKGSALLTFQIAILDIDELKKMILHVETLLAALSILRSEDLIEGIEMKGRIKIAESAISICNELEEVCKDYGVNVKYE